MFSYLFYLVYHNNIILFTWTWQFRKENSTCRIFIGWFNNSKIMLTSWTIIKTYHIGLFNIHVSYWIFYESTSIIIKIHIDSLGIKLDIFKIHVSYYTFYQSTGTKCEIIPLIFIYR